MSGTANSARFSSRPKNGRLAQDPPDKREVVSSILTRPILSTSFPVKSYELPFFRHHHLNRRKTPDCATKCATKFPKKTKNLSLTSAQKAVFRCLKYINHFAITLYNSICQSIQRSSFRLRVIECATNCATEYDFLAFNVPKSHICMLSSRTNHCHIRGSV